MREKKRAKKRIRNRRPTPYDALRAAYQKSIAEADARTDLEESAKNRVISQLNAATDRLQAFQNCAILVSGRTEPGPIKAYQLAMSIDMRQIEDNFMRSSRMPLSASGHAAEIAREMCDKLATFLTKEFHKMMPGGVERW